jgi:predicted HD phosphohydrolase
MSREEAERFEHEPLLRDAVALRRADEAAKVAGLPVLDLESWLAALTATCATTRR